MATPDARLLAAVPLFQGLDAKALADVQANARTVRAAAGRVFFREGERARVFYVLRKGRVTFTQVSPEGHEVILRVIGPGEPFGGVAAFVENAVYPVTARAVEAAEAYAWDGPRMLGLMRRFPDMAINAARLIADRLHELQRQHRELMTERVERRVARALVRLAQSAGRRVEGGVEIDFPLSREDLARMTGTTLFTVSRILSAWKQQGLIATARRRVVVRQPHGIVRIAEDMGR
ncbi:MAG TPA: Crp/Fnr family transcriptional regulator [Vicinamibacterales bacterium]|nr:Crp/Fnr family transcriptional regulator [Vicinamibacterales bacterium]